MNPNNSASFHGVNPTFQGGVSIQTVNHDGSSDPESHPGVNLTVTSSLAAIGNAHTASDAAYKLQLESQAMEHNARREHMQDINRRREIDIAAQHTAERKRREEDDLLADQLAYNTLQQNEEFIETRRRSNEYQQFLHRSRYTRGVKSPDSPTSYFK